MSVGSGRRNVGGGSSRGNVQVEEAVSSPHLVEGVEVLAAPPETSHRRRFDVVLPHLLQSLLQALEQ